MNTRTYSAGGFTRTLSLIALTLSFAAAGCSSNLYQTLSQNSKNMLMSKSSTAAAPSTPAGGNATGNLNPAPTSAAAPANTPSMTSAGAPPPSAGQPSSLPYQVSTTPDAKAAGQSPACKNASAGACQAFAGGSTNGVGQAFCMASCTAQVCGQSDMARYYSQQAAANGMTCTSGQ